MLHHPSYMKKLYVTFLLWDKVTVVLQCFSMDAACYAFDSVNNW